MSKGLFDTFHDGVPRVRPGQRKALTFRGNMGEGRHGWLRLTPAYSLHVVKGILRHAPRNCVVLEPFSGTGTTPLACAEAGLVCDAIDINPFLVWLGNLKLMALSERDAASLLDAGPEVIGNAQAQLQASSRPWVPPIHQIEKWWNPETLRSLGALFAAVSAAAVPGQVRDLMKVAFCRVMIAVANVSFGHQSMSFRRRALPEASLLPCPVDCFESFASAVREMAASLVPALPQHECQVHLGDSRRVQQAVRRRDYSLVVTSPPYPNRMSYIRELRPYMYWLGYLQDGKQAGDLDWQAIGGTWGCATSLLARWQTPPEFPVPFDGFPSIISAISENEPLLGQYVHKYFSDTVQHIRGLAGVLAPGAVCHYVVGNSKFYETLLPTQAIYASIFASEGFDAVQVSELRKRTSKKDLYEYVVRAEKQ